MLLLSQLSSQRKTVNGETRDVSFIVIKKAYFNELSKRCLHLFRPRELGLGGKAMPHLRRCAYGTRDAGMIWEETYTHALIDMGFRRGLASPRCFYHAVWQVSADIRGDDSKALGPRMGLTLYRQGLEGAFELKVEGHLGEVPKQKVPPKQFRCALHS